MTDDLREIFERTDNLDKRSMQFLIKAIQKNNIQGFDYIEFKQSLLKLKSLDFDTDTAIKSAFATASTMGLSKKNLIDSAKHYHDVLIKEKNEFDNALEKQIQTRISTRRNQAKKLEEKIIELENKVKEIQQKITEYQNHISETENEIAKSEAKITETKDKFEITHRQIISEIESDIERFSQQL